jgi:rubrerythrin
LGEGKDKEGVMSSEKKEVYTCQHCGAEADIIVEGFEDVAEVIRKSRKRKVACRGCGQQTEIEIRTRPPFACEHCGAEADMTIEGFEKVEDVLRRNKALSCRSCGKDIRWAEQEDLKAVEMAIEAERQASQFYSQASKKTRNPKGRDLFQQLSEFEAAHLQKLKELMASLQHGKEWIIYSGTSLRQKTIPVKLEKPKGQEQLTDMDALRMAIRAEKKTETYYRSMAELTRDAKGRGMYKRLAEEEALHERVLNDQYYSVQNTGVWSWGD